MALFTLKQVQLLPISPEQAWAFFSSPGNLKVITPEHMDFRVTSDPHFLGELYAGQVIAYTVRPLLGIRLHWLSEITHVQENRFFVDDQRVGPYALWHHQHHFRAIPGGVEMTDLVHYRLPLGFLGRIAYALFVRKQLEAIFDFRRKKLEELFGKMPGQTI